MSGRNAAVSNERIIHVKVAIYYFDADVTGA